MVQTGAECVSSGQHGRISGRVARSRDPEMTGNDLPVDMADGDRRRCPAADAVVTTYALGPFL